jgi:hypothetical protein
LSLNGTINPISHTFSMMQCVTKHVDIMCRLSITILHLLVLSRFSLCLPVYCVYDTNTFHVLIVNFLSWLIY